MDLAGVMAALPHRYPMLLVEDTYYADGAALDDAALRTRVTAFQAKQTQANQELERTQENIRSIQANVLRQINVRLTPAIQQVMAARGANMAVDVSSLLGHAPAVDATPAVLAALNRTLTSVSLTPLPAGTAAEPGR